MHMRIGHTHRQGETSLGSPPLIGLYLFFLSFLSNRVVSLLAFYFDFSKIFSDLSESMGASGLSPTQRDPWLVRQK